MTRAACWSAFGSLLLATFAFAADEFPSPAPAGADWPAYNKTLDGQRYSLLTEINEKNATQLTEVCRVRVATRGSLQAGLVVIDGTLYATTPADTFAIDATTCRIKWQHTYRRTHEPGLQVNRGVAYLNGRIFRGTDEGHLLALDATTGHEIWNNVVGDANIGEYIAAAPLAWNGLIIVGLSGGEYGIRGRILAFDALTGRELWRFNTIPTGKEPGAETWGRSGWAAHGGGGTWSTFALDPITAEVFAPIGNPVPDFTPGERRGANLYTNSVLVLDARTGERHWWYQLQPADDHDHDLGAAPLLFRNSRSELMLAAAGKDGLLHIVDRVTHQARFKVPVTTVDSPRKTVTAAGTRVCPGPAGGVLWNGPALDPKRMTLFVGAADLCMTLRAETGSSYKARSLHLGGSVAPESRDVPTGWVTAVDANTGVVKWKYHSETPVFGGVTPTAGGVVMTGDNAGNFLVFDSENGAVLRKEASGGAIAGGVVTYQQNGKQYVAFTSGNTSPASFSASVGRPSIIVMALPGAGPAATTSTVADPARGGQVYSQVCAGCHGPQGDRVGGKDLRAVKSHMNAEQLAAFIAHPTGAMPKLFPEAPGAEDARDIRDVAAFVLSLKP